MLDYDFSFLAKDRCLRELDKLSCWPLMVLSGFLEIHEICVLTVSIQTISWHLPIQYDQLRLRFLIERVNVVRGVSLLY